MNLSRQSTAAHSSVLSSATSGYHYHLIEASSQERLDLIGEQLKKAGFLAPLQPWEKEKRNNIEGIQKMTIAEIQQEILRMKKNRISVFLHTHIRVRRFWKWQIIQEIPMA